jgi:hypothetical protein
MTAVTREPREPSTLRFLGRALVRPIYARLGVLPEVASGMQAAAELTRPPQE